MLLILRLLASDDIFANHRQVTHVFALAAQQIECDKARLASSEEKITKLRLGVPVDADLALVDKHERPEAFPLDLEKPVWMREGSGFATEWHGLEMREGHWS
jgi:hypothetical protein